MLEIDRSKLFETFDPKTMSLKQIDLKFMYNPCPNYRTPGEENITRIMLPLCYEMGWKTRLLRGHHVYYEAGYKTYPETVAEIKEILLEDKPQHWGLFHCDDELYIYWY